MDKTATKGGTKMVKSILIFGIVNCALYIILFLLFRSLSLLHISELRMLNYLVLGLVSFYQIRWQIKQRGERISFLKAFVVTFLTGTVSFIGFALFILIYSFSDPYFAALYFNAPDGTLKIVPFILIAFEGSAASIIIGMISMMYANKKEEEG